MDDEELYDEEELYAPLGSAARGFAADVPAGSALDYDEDFIKRLLRARQQLTAERSPPETQADYAKPSRAETLLSLGSALSKPTRVPGVSGMIGSIADVFLQQEQGKRAAQEEQRRLAGAYGLEGFKQGSAMDREVYKATAAQGRANTMAAATAGKPVRQIINDEFGTRVVEYRPDTGESTTSPVGGGSPNSAGGATPQTYSDRDSTPVGGVWIEPETGIPHIRTKTEFKPMYSTPSSEAAGKAAVKSAEIAAETQASAAIALKDAEVAVPAAEKAVDDLVNHPGLSAYVGLPDPSQGGFRLFNVPGTPAANFKARLDQLRGTVFLEGYKTLKGGGQITEIEGKKAEQAIARLDEAQSEVEFVQALNDYKDALGAGFAKLRLQAGGSPNRAPNRAPNRDPNRPSLKSILGE